MTNHLHEQCELAYRVAETELLLSWDAEAVRDGIMDIAELRTLREGIRSTLLDDFPEVDARELAEIMDDVLSTHGFPLDEI